MLTVGAESHQGTASRSDDVLAAFSSRGPTWIDFAAKPDLRRVRRRHRIALRSAQHALLRRYSAYLLDGTGRRRTSRT